MLKNIALLVMTLLGVGTLYAQQPQTSDLPPLTPDFAVNAKYTNGVAPGYKVTSQTSNLTLTVGPGTAFCSGAVQTYAGGTLAMSPSTTNYVYLSTSASCAPSVKTTTFSAIDIPVAIVTTGVSSISGIVDVRTPFTQGGTSVQVNGSIVINPNFNGSSPAVDANFIANTYKASGSNVITETPFGTNSAPGAVQCDTTTTTCSGGVVSAIAGAKLNPTLTPPIAGQYVFVPATTTQFISTDGYGRIGPSSGYISLGHGGSFQINENIMWSGYTLPSYVNPANITAVYAIAISQIGPINGANFYLDCFPSGSGLGNGLVPTVVGQTVQTSKLVTVSTWNTAYCQADLSANYSTGSYENIQQIGFLVYYTGTAPPANVNATYVQPPLYINAANNNALGINIPFDTSSDTTNTNTYSAPYSGYPAQANQGTSVKLIVSHNNTSTTPSFVFNSQNAATIVGPTGAALVAGDITTANPAILLWDGTYWRLQNPQVSGSGSAGVTTVRPSGDTTGGTDGSAIQSACTTGANIQLVAGTYYVGKTNTPVTLSNVCNIAGSGQASTIIQNEGTTNSTIVVNTSNLSTDLPPYSNPLPVGGNISGFTIREDSSLTPTAGAGLEVGTNSTTYTTNYTFSNINIQGTYRMIQADQGFWNNRFQNMILWNPVSTNCVYFDVPSPGGDAVFDTMMFVGTTSASPCNFYFNRSDTNRIHNLKFNNGNFTFGGANAISNVFISDTNIEGPTSCAFDFSAGSSTNYGVFNFTNIEFEVGSTGLTPNPVCSPSNAPGLNIANMCLGGVAGFTGKCFNGPASSMNWVPTQYQAYDNFGGGNGVAFGPSATNYIQGWAQFYQNTWPGPLYFLGTNQVYVGGGSAIGAYYLSITPKSASYTTSEGCTLGASGGGWCMVGTHLNSPSSSSYNGYSCIFQQGTGQQLLKWTSAASTQIGTTDTTATGGTHINGIVASVSGSTVTLTCQLDGVNSTHATGTDTTYPAAGYPWFAMNGAGVSGYSLNWPFTVQ